MQFPDLNTLEPAQEIADPVDQAEQEWLAKRLGKFTCSRFGDLMQMDRSKKDDIFGQTALAYIRMKLAERLGSWHSMDARSMKWGRDNEASAILEYQSLTGKNVDVDRFRFFEFNDYIGGTPDGLISDDGTLEIKCPYYPAEHMKTVISREVPKEYVWQVDGHMLVTGRSWCDFMSFDPRIRSSDPRRQVIIRVERNQKRLDYLKYRLDLAEKNLNLWMEETSG